MRRPPLACRPSPPQGQGYRIWILAKKDPHPNPPHKGEGTLPRAIKSSLAPKRQAIGLGQRQRK
ncbi:MAG: hypothetical protein EOS27_33405, partial [Mesorhizobium sp.]